jgi:hypothetical protein
VSGHQAWLEALQEWTPTNLPAPFAPLDRADQEEEDDVELELVGPSLGQLGVLAASLGVLWAAWRLSRR